MRDDFSAATKEILAKRVGYKCSNPNCRKPTSGPQSDPEKTINIGVAAHITAASSDGPRYDPFLSKVERKAVTNGIWLCQSCSKLIDSDVFRYTIGLLSDWKRMSEEAALLEIEHSKPSISKRNKDRDLMRFYSQCLDRPAFQDAFLRERQEYEAFDKAIEDTITAINTGCLRSRDGVILAKARGKSYLENKAWRAKMDLIVDLLRAVRLRYKSIREAQSFEAFHKLGMWMDMTRDQVIQTFNEICVEADIPLLRSPKDFW